MSGKRTGCSNRGESRRRSSEMAMAARERRRPPVDLARRQGRSTSGPHAGAADRHRLVQRRAHARGQPWRRAPTAVLQVWRRQNRGGGAHTGSVHARVAGGGGAGSGDETFGYRQRRIRGSRRRSGRGVRAAARPWGPCCGAAVST
jgi:hypothetical protein